MIRVLLSAPGIVSKCVWEPVHMLTLFKGIFSPSVYHKAIYDKHMVQICGSLWTLKSVNFLSYSVRQSRSVFVHSRDP